MSLTAAAVYLLLTLLFLGGFWRPILAVLGYITIYSVYNPYAWWVVSTRHLLPRPSLIAISFVIAAALVNYRKLNWSISRREIELYLFLGACWLSTTVFGISLEADSWEYLLKITKILIFVFFFIRVVNSIHNVRLVIWSFIFSGLFLSYQAHLVTTAGRVDSIGGIDFGEANGFAAFLAITIIFTAFRFLDASWLKKIFYVLGIALMCDTIILTQSRAVLIGIIAAVPYVLFRAPPKKFKQIFVYLILGIIMFVNLMDDNFLSRMGTIGESIQSVRSSNVSYEKPSIDRLDFWKASLLIFKDHPMGIGIKNFKKIVPLYDPRNSGIDSHNTYVQTYTEIGIIGIILFIVIMLEAIVQMNRIRRIVRGTPYESEILSYVTPLGAALLLYFCGYMLTHSILYTEILWILLSMPICLEYASMNLCTQSPAAVDDHTPDAAMKLASY